MNDPEDREEERTPDDAPPKTERAQRRLSLTRLLMWAEIEAQEIGRAHAAGHINAAIHSLFGDAIKKG